MTTKQLIARVKKYFRVNGSISLKGMSVHEMTQGMGKMINLDRLCVDDNQLGVMAVQNSWFIPLEELTFSELKNVLKHF